MNQSNNCNQEEFAYDGEERRGESGGKGSISVTYTAVAYAFGGLLMAIVIFLLTVGYNTVSGKLDKAEYLKDYQRGNADIAAIRVEQENTNIKLDTIKSTLAGLPELKQLMINSFAEQRGPVGMKSKAEIRKEVYGK